jgi:CRP-like cAMP-binding protein
LSCLPDAALDGLLRRARNVRFEKGASVYQRGDTGDSLMIILSGRIKIFNIATSSREIVLNFLGPGDVNGELSALDGKGRSADAVALEPVEAVALLRRDLLPVLQQHPEAMFTIITSLAARVRALSSAAEHNLLQMAARAASGLLRLADTHGRETDDGILIDLSLSQRDLGNYLGLSRENTSRELKRLKDAELIDVEGTKITLLDVDGLKDYSEIEDD